ncbi:MAG: nucleic acid-binding protein [Anaerolinea sp.]|nr:nucleic acid-binding protein [Anaerolinea sp.]
MTRVFADTQYWLAVTDRRDQWAPVAARAMARITRPEIVTTDEVLVEFLGFVCGGGRYLRELGLGVVRMIDADPSVTVVPRSRTSFLDGLALYEARPDKGYSLVDCISMVTMRELGIGGALTADRHFRQEGFRALLLDEV